MKSKEDIFDIGVSLFDTVISKLPIGRACGNRHWYGHFAEIIAEAGDGNYLEIGTLFGASAIFTCKIKEILGISGKCFCIDPFLGYYKSGVLDSGIEVSKANVNTNFQFAECFDVFTIAKSSIPFPEEAQKQRYSLSFIDGDHWGNAPLIDFKNVSVLTDGIVVFDDFNETHPDIVSAALTSVKGDWIPISIREGLFTLSNTQTFTNPHAWAGGNFTNEE